MNSIYVLSISNEEEEFDMYFSTHQKAVEFIGNNFNNDIPRKINSNMYEGKNNVYCITDWVIDQEIL